MFVAMMGPPNDLLTSARGATCFPSHVWLLAAVSLKHTAPTELSEEEGGSAGDTTNMSLLRS
jgi:hypothetical protein